MNKIKDCVLCMFATILIVIAFPLILFASFLFAFVGDDYEDDWI